MRVYGVNYCGRRVASREDFYSSRIVVFRLFCVEGWRCVAAPTFNASASLSIRVTSSRARFDLHALTRRCRVRSCALEYIAGASATRRSCSFLAVMPGSDSSHCWIVGHVCSNGSCRLRHVWGTPAFRWWVGITSPSCHAVPKLTQEFCQSNTLGYLCLGRWDAAFTAGRNVPLCFTHPRQQIQRVERPESSSEFAFGCRRHLGRS